MKKKFKANGGFTLVELIVVIAILAILGGVAVPAYSGYVKKANMGVDETLAGEIKHALTLAHYSGVLEPGASVVVSMTDLTIDGGSEDYGTDAAMQAVFGAGYADTLRLKYDGWSGEMGVAADREMMEAVDNSNFTTDEMDSLLGQVQTVVNAAQGAMAGMKPAEGSVLADSLNKAGITLNEDGEIKEEDAGAAANALVFSVADDISKGNVNQDNFAQSWMMYAAGATTTFGYEGIDNVSKAAIEYAAVLSLAQYIDKQNAENASYVSYANKLQGYEGDDILGNRDAVHSEMLTYLQKEENKAVSEGYLNEYENDSKAFLAYMNGVTQSSDSLLENESLYKENFFGDGTVSSYVKDYVSIGEVLASVNTEDGAFVIYYSGTDVRCLPLDY